MQRRIRLAALATTTAAVMALMPGQAIATHMEHDHATDPAPSDRYWTCTEGNYWAVACFANEGEWFAVADNQRGGYSVLVDWKLKKTNGELLRQGRVWHTGGFDDPYRHKNKSFGEDLYLQFRACRGQHSAPHDVHTGTCTNWRGAQT